LYPQPTKEKDSSLSDHIFVKSNSKFFKVNFSEILFIEAMKDYLKIHTRELRLVTLQTMNDMEKILPATQFIRVHKSYIIAVANIKSIYGNTVEIENKTIPIGISYKNKVMHLVNKK
jgi:two-component system LytT family response regulator